MFIDQVMCAVLLAFAGTLFYKKSFTSKELPLVFCSIVLALTFRWILKDPLQSFATTVCFLLLLDTAHRNELINSIKTSKKSMFFTLFFVLSDSEFQLGSNLLTTALKADISTSTWIKVRAIFAMVPQGIRKPLWLKDKLQELRSHLGPVFVISIFELAFCVENNHKTAFTRGLMYFAAFCAFLAGTIFRPDNSAVSGLFQKSTEIGRKKCHRSLMMIASAVLVLDCAFFG